MMNKKVVLIIISLAVLGCLLAAILSPAWAAEPGTISVSNSKVTLSFPQSMSFSAQIKSNINITDIRLRYKVDQMSFADVISESFVQFTASTSVNATYSLDLRRFGGFPPGTTMQYWWMVKDSNQSVFESTPLTYRIEDNRYTWKNTAQGKISLYWYKGDNAFARSLMDSAQNGLLKLAKDTGASPQKIISIYIYASAQDLQGSMIYPNEWTGGVSFSQYNIITIGVDPSNVSWGESAMVHELTHNVIAQVIFNPYDDLPVWLNEGLAMYNQGPLTSQFQNPLSKAIRDNQLLSVKMISSPFSAYSEKATLSYAESYTLVDYLIQKFGTAKISALFQSFKQGNTFDGAFQDVLGIDQNGLNQQWQPWVKANYAK
jgi:hypothetical protein